MLLQPTLKKCESPFRPQLRWPLFLSVLIGGQRVSNCCSLSRRNLKVFAQLRDVFGLKSQSYAKLPSGPVQKGKKSTYMMKLSVRHIQPEI
jgi:hypothetical protein